MVALATVALSIFGLPGPAPASLPPPVSPPGPKTPASPDPDPVPADNAASPHPSPTENPTRVGLSVDMADNPTRVDFSARGAGAGAGARAAATAVAGGVDASGRAVLVWSRRGRRGSRILVATAPPGRRFGRPRTIPGVGSAPKAAVAPGGRTVVAYRYGHGSRVVVGDARGRFGRPRLLSHDRFPEALRIAGDGTAAVLLSAGRKESTVQILGRDGRPGPPRTVATDPRAITLAAGPDGTFAIVTGLGTVVERRPGERRFRHVHEVPLDRRTEAAVVTNHLRLAVGPRGRIALVGQTPRACVAETVCYGGVRFVERPAGARRFAKPIDAPVTQRQTDAGEIPTAFGADVAYDATGTPTVVWTEDTNVCKRCSTHRSSGRAVAWTPGGQRVDLSPNSRFTQVAPLVSGVLAAIRTGDSTELWLARSGRGTKLTSLKVRIGSGTSLVASGGDRVLIAVIRNGRIEADLGTLSGHR